MAARFIYVKGWGSFPSGNAYQLYDGFKSMKNSHGHHEYVAHPAGDHYVPMLGDLIILSKQSGLPVGHVSVVDSVTDTFVSAVEQNWSSTGVVRYYGWATSKVTRKVRFSGGRLENQGTYRLTGYVHAKANTFGLDSSAWLAVGNAAISTSRSERAWGAFNVALPEGGDSGVWSGAASSRGTAKGNYEFFARARLLKGPGYGVAMRTTFDANGVPTGRAFQYDPGAGGVRDTDYPEDQGATTATNLNSAAHTVRVRVRGTKYSMYLDGKLVSDPNATTALTGGRLYIRVWSFSGFPPDATVELSNVAIFVL